MTAAWQTVAARSEAVGTDLVITKPTGTVDGDLLVFVGVCGAGQTISKPDVSWTTAAFSLGGQAPCFYKIASGEGANWTFVVSGSVSSIGQVARFNAVDTSTPIGVGSGNFTAAAGGLAIPSVTTTGANNLLAQMVAKLSNTTMTGPAGVEQWDATAPSQNVVYAGGSEVVGAGATGTRTWTPAAGTSPFIAYMMEVNPAPPKTGTFSGSYDFTGTGFTGAEGPGVGTFAGGFDFTGSVFAGEAGPGVGTFVGGYDFTGGPFTGEAPGVASGSFIGGYDFTGSGFVGERTGEGSFVGGYDFSSAGFTGSAPSPTGQGDIFPGGRDRFTARRTPKNRRRVR
jgi:hypothetical protein